MKKNLGPEWAKSAVFYQIYPQSFYDSNGDGIGDLPGIIQKLDYIESLGVSAIWVNPCFVSPFLDAGYDVADYYHVAPRYGTDADLFKLFREAKNRGIHVLLDLVPGHTSIDHPWFKASCSPEKNEFSNRYIWTDSVWRNGGAKWAGKMIQGFCDRDGSYMINYFWSQPALNFGFAKPDQPWQLPVTHPDVQATWQEMRNIMRYWLDKGASGFRVDMAGSIIRNDPGAKEAKRFWRETRAMLDRDYPEAFIVSEWTCPENAIPAGFHADFFHFNKGYYGLLRGEPFRAGPGAEHWTVGASFFDAKGQGDVTGFLDLYLEQYRKTKNKGYISVPVGNHDLGRINNRRSKKDLELIMAFLLTFPGTPFIYYGDEIGMKHLPDTPNREGGYQPRIGARTPMQWTAKQKDNGYLPIDKSKDAPNVAAQEKRKDSLLNMTRELVKLRRTEPALAADAKLDVLYVKKQKCPLVFLRSKGREKILVAFNPAAREVSILLSVPNGTNIAGSGATLAEGKLTMRGRSYGIWKLA